MVSYLQLALEYFPTVYRIRNFKPTTVEETVDFAFDPKNRVIAPAQLRTEITPLLTYIKGKNIRNVLEIGSANGGTLFMIAKTVRLNAHLISLDFGYTKFAGLMLLAKRFLFSSFLLGGDVTLINADSHKLSTLETVLEKAMETTDDYIDLLFIDGDHTYEGVKQDFEMYNPLVKEGGLIVFHDIWNTPTTTNGVKQFWNEIKTRYEHFEIIDDLKKEVYGIGILVNVKKTNNDNYN